MISPEFVRLMAAYTVWQNDSIYSAAGSLSDTARKQDRGAFFGSIHRTLNHLLWGDQVWLHRLADADAPTIGSIAASTTQFESWDDLRSAREQTDGAMLAWAGRVTPRALEGELRWFSGALDAEVCRPRWALVVQLFNHGTHHRGQVHAMLTQAGARPADTDVQFMPADFYSWPG